MLIQPFIENAIEHGILPQKEIMGIIQIRFGLEGGTMCITVSDNGIGLSKSKEKQGEKGFGKSMGIKVTEQRLHVHFNGKSELEIEELTGPEASNGTRITITYPYFTVQKQSI